MHSEVHLLNLQATANKEHAKHYSMQDKGGKYESTSEM